MALPQARSAWSDMGGGLTLAASPEGALHRTLSTMTVAPDDAEIADLFEQVMIPTAGLCTLCLE